MNMKYYMNEIKNSIPEKSCLSPIIEEAKKDKKLTENELETIKDMCMCLLMTYSTNHFVA